MSGEKLHKHGVTFPKIPRENKLLIEQGRVCRKHIPEVRPCKNNCLLDSLLPDGSQNIAVNVPIAVTVMSKMRWNVCPQAYAHKKAKEEKGSDTNSPKRK